MDVGDDGAGYMDVGHEPDDAYVELGDEEEDDDFNGTSTL
jgi:hypothetical protein